MNMAIRGSMPGLQPTRYPMPTRFGGSERAGRYVDDDWLERKQLEIVPIYRQAAERLLRERQTGQLKDCDVLPPEFDVSQICGIHPYQVNTLLGMLVEKGVIHEGTNVLGVTRYFFSEKAARRYADKPLATHLREMMAITAKNPGATEQPVKDITFFAKWFNQPREAIEAAFKQLAHEGVVVQQDGDYFLPGGQGQLL